MNSLTPKIYKKTYCMAKVFKKLFEIEVMRSLNLWSLGTSVMTIEIKDNSGHILLSLSVLSSKIDNLREKNAKKNKISALF